MHFTAITLPMLALASSAMASCGHGIDFLFPRSDKTLNARAFSPPKWSYETTTGPLLWHTVDPTYYACANGTNQSPILLSSSSSPTVNITIELPTQDDIEFENLLTTVEVVANGSLTVDNTSWNLAQFHFHTPSEHRLDLNHYDAEVHFVFTAADGSPRLSVVGFFIEVTAAQSTAFLKTVFSYLDEIKEPGSSTHIPILDFDDFPENANAMNFFQYSGSLTTPPCTQGVSWYVGDQPIQLNVDTYYKLKTFTKTNNRYTQNTPGQTNLLQLAAKPLCEK